MADPLVFGDAMPLVRAIHAALLFLEDTPADELDPDAAVRAQEWVMPLLQQLRGADRTVFRRALTRLAQETKGRESEFATELSRSLF